MAQIIAQRYHILEELGQGGMGTVYRGLDTQTQQTIAIKHLKPELTTPELVERFVREGHALRELNHPNIVKMLDSIQEDGNHYLIMEYLAGGDLNSLLKMGQLPIEKVLQLALDICDALTRAHRLDIIHRDLKPANVLLADDGTPRLTDFGIARIGKKERVTATDAIVGTVDYLAPEVLDGNEIDARADIWAFGVMLFEILAGERPFKGVSVAQTLMAIVTQPVPDLEVLRPDAPVSLIDLIYRMLEKSCDARIRSVRQVGLELEDILHGRTQQTPPETRFAPETPNFLLRPKHNLPAQTTPFVGREAEIDELAKLLNDSKVRLVTILASGGMGKTRLALEVAEQQLTNFENGVYFVELAPLSDPANIISAIAEATGYQFQSDGREPKQQILDFLANKSMLLVLDNFEHLLQGASLVTEILKAAPQVKILATSRQRLNQSGETLFNLEGMDFPAWETPADALEYAAVKLFMQSAKRAKPDFDITPDNMDAIARICKLVQGMPLGIVLAAAWLSMLSPEEIAVEIVKGIDFLESELSDLPERHQSIRAVFDYSWDLLTDDEKQVFMKLSVFRGGFTREAAEAVAGANLRSLMNLMNKSLIRRDADSGRYEIHELLRQYGEEKLHMVAVDFEETRNAHSVYYAHFCSKRAEEIRGTREAEAFAANDLDIDNIMLAWDWMTEHQDTESIWQSLFNIIWHSYWRNSTADTFHFWSRAIAALEQMPDNPDKLQLLAIFYHSLSSSAGLFGQIEEQKKLVEKGWILLGQVEKLSTRWEAMMPLASLGIGSYFATGNMSRSLTMMDYCFATSKTKGYLWDYGNTHILRLFMIWDLDYNTHAPMIKQSLSELTTTATYLRNPFLLRFSKWLTASAHNRHGNYREAKRLYEEVWFEFTSVGNRVGIQMNLVQALLKLGEYDEAEWHCKTVTRYCKERNAYFGIYTVIAFFADLIALRGDKLRGVELASFAADHASEFWIKEHLRLLLERLEADFEPKVFARAVELGKTLNVDDIVQTLLAESVEDA